MCLINSCIVPILIFLLSLRCFKLFQRQSGWSCLFWNLLFSMDFTSYMQCFASDSRWWPIWILVLLWSSQPWWNGASTTGRQTCNLLTDSHSPNIQHYPHSDVHHLSLWDQLHLALWLLPSWTYWGWYWMRPRTMQMQMVIVSSTYHEPCGIDVEIGPLSRWSMPGVLCIMLHWAPSKHGGVF